MYWVKQDWFEQYHEWVIKAEHVILSTLNFELNVQHHMLLFANLIC